MRNAAMKALVVLLAVWLGGVAYFVVSLRHLQQKTKSLSVQAEELSLDMSEFAQNSTQAHAKLSKAIVVLSAAVENNRPQAEPGDRSSRKN